jgi:RND family efflux transporter MFP subunit
MNYETRVADLGGTSDVLVEDAERTDGGIRRRRLLIAGVVLALLLIGGALLYFGQGEEAPFAASEGEQVPTVSIMEPGRTTVQGTIISTGSLAARHEVAVGVVGEGGRVVSVPVQIGDWVHAGQVLAVIDRSVQSQQAASSAANIDVAKADADLAQANLDRALQLVDRGFISKADVDRLTATRDAAAARVKVAEAQYRELLARNARLNIVAPVAGLVLDRNVEVGQVLGSGGTAPFTMAQGGELELLANLNEDDLAAVSVGSPAEVTPVGSDKSFAGRIWQLPQIIDPQTRQGAARIALPYDKALRPGGFATAEITRGALVAPRLPESAIMSDEQGSYVYIVNGENRVERLNVKTGIVTDEGIAIVAGLNGTERVVARAGGFLNEGDRVSPVRMTGATQAAGQ